MSWHEIAHLAAHFCLGVTCLGILFHFTSLVAAAIYVRAKTPGGLHLPPVSVLKPVRGVDPDAYENFASFCRQDYPEYEILFGVQDPEDPAVELIRRLQ